MSEIRKIRPVVVIRPPLSTLESKQTHVNLKINSKGEYIIDLGQGSTFTVPHVYGYQCTDLNTLAPREVDPLLKNAVQSGEAMAVLLYGETNTGKSYLCGTLPSSSSSSSRIKDDPIWQNSIGAFTARRIWQLADELSLGALDVRCSFIEIYRESSSKDQVFDLLDGYTRKKLVQQYAEGVSHHVTSPRELLDKLIEGSALRNTDRTDGNARSSRSHAIFTIEVAHTRQSSRTSDPGSERVRGKIMLVDLAGAESAAAATVGTQQHKAGSGINVGLSALQTVINEVSEKGSTVQYRLSKLTYLLKPALGGATNHGCNVLFIGCLSPLALPNCRSKTTLSFLQKAARIGNTVGADIEKMEAKMVKTLEKERNELLEKIGLMAAEMQSLKDSLATSNSNENQHSRGDKTLNKRTAQHVVVLSLDEHQRLLADSIECRDKIAALEIVLKDADEKYHLIQEELDMARERADIAENAMLHATATTTLTESLSSLPVVQDGEAATFTRQGVTVIEPPRYAALSVAPILAAASCSDAALGFMDTARSGNLMTPLVEPSGYLGDLLSQDDLTVDDIVMPCSNGNEEDSNLEKQQLDVLKSLIERRLEDAISKKHFENDDDTLMSRQDIAQVAAVLQRRAAEIAALRLVVSAYNECLGLFRNELEICKEKEERTNQQLQQAAREKVMYVELTAKFSQALDISQADVSDLLEEITELKKSSQPSNNTGSGLFARVLLGRTSAGGTATPNSMTPPTSPSRSLHVSPVKTSYALTQAAAAVEGDWSKRNSSGISAAATAAAAPRTSFSRLGSLFKAPQSASTQGVSGSGDAVMKSGSGGGISEECTRKSSNSSKSSLTTHPLKNPENDEGG